MRVLLTKSRLAAVAILLLLSCPELALGQNQLQDAELLSSHIKQQNQVESGRDRSFRYLQEDAPIKKYNPLALTLGGLMYTYQRFISPQLPSQCLYHHSCSGFSIRLIEEFGLIGGVVTTADRLMRCNRMAAVDIHPMHIHESSGRVLETPAIYRRPK